MHALHNFLGFNINKTALCLGRSNLHLLLLKSSMDQGFRNLMHSKSVLQLWSHRLFTKPMSMGTQGLSGGGSGPKNLSSCHRTPKYIEKLTVNLMSSISRICKKVHFSNSTRGQVGIVYYKVYLLFNILMEYQTFVKIGPWWWSGGQRACLLIRGTEFESLKSSEKSKKSQVIGLLKVG